MNPQDVAATPPRRNAIRGTALISTGLLVAAAVLAGLTPPGGVSGLQNWADADAGDAFAREAFALGERDHSREKIAAGFRDFQESSGKLFANDADAAPRRVYIVTGWQGQRGRWADVGPVAVVTGPANASVVSDSSVSREDVSIRYDWLSEDWSPEDGLKRVSGAWFATLPEALADARAEALRATGLTGEEVVGLRYARRATLAANVTSKPLLVDEKRLGTVYQAALLVDVRRLDGPVAELRRRRGPAAGMLLGGLAVLTGLIGVIGSLAARDTPAVDPAAPLGAVSAQASAAGTSPSQAGRWIAAAVALLMLVSAAATLVVFRSHTGSTEPSLILGAPPSPPELDLDHLIVPPQPAVPSEPVVIAPATDASEPSGRSGPDEPETL